MTDTGDMSVAGAVPKTEHRSPASVETDRGADELVIQPRRGWIAVDWRELWRSRELLYFLVWRDIKVRYKQAVLGIAWAVLQPAVQMLVFTLIFGVAAGFRKSLPNVPYSVFVLSGLLPWQLFATAWPLSWTGRWRRTRRVSRSPCETAGASRNMSSTPSEAPGIR